MSRTHHIAQDGIMGMSNDACTRCGNDIEDGNGCLSEEAYVEYQKELKVDAATSAAKARMREAFLARAKANAEQITSGAANPCTSVRLTANFVECTHLGPYLRSGKVRDGSAYIICEACGHEYLPSSVQVTPAPAL